MSQVYLSWTSGTGDKQRIYRETNPDRTAEEPAFPSEYDLIDTVSTATSDYVDGNAPETDIIYYAFTAVETGTESAPVVDTAGTRLQDNSNTDGSVTDQIALSDEWTPQWQSTYEDWTVVDSTEYEGGTALAFEHSGSDPAPFALSWDSVGTQADVELLDEFRVPTAMGAHARAYLRGSGDSGSETAYWVDLDKTNGVFRLGKYTNGTATTLQTFGTPAENTFYYRRFRAESSELKVKVWPASQTEPADWSVSVTDSDIADGWVGLGSLAPDLVETTVLSIATAGGSAEPIGFDSRPSVSWVGPTDGETVSGTVTGQIDASDSEDSDDSLLVEYRIGGSTWSEAPYNTETGAYVFSWDTTSVADGNHTLEASVTDSGGNTASTAITVTTDNSGVSPAVDSFSAIETATDSADAEFDVNWAVSDPDGNLDTVDLRLQGSDGSTKDELTVSVGGEAASDTSRLVATGEGGSGNSYTIDITVTDAEGNAATQTETVTASVSATTAPVINRLSVSEAGRSGPHAEVTAVWDVSHPDGELAEVDITVSASGTTVQQVSWSLFGSSASDTDSFRIENGDGQQFEITLTTTDQAGNSVSKSATVTA
jgi:hypothetical protein